VAFFQTAVFWDLVVNGLGVVLQTAGLCRSPCVSALDAGENLLAALVQNTEAIWLLRQIHILEHGLLTFAASKSGTFCKTRSRVACALSLQRILKNSNVKTIGPCWHRVAMSV